DEFVNSLEPSGQSPDDQKILAQSKTLAQKIFQPGIRSQKPLNPQEHSLVTLQLMHKQLNQNNLTGNNTILHEVKQALNVLEEKSPNPEFNQLLKRLKPLIDECLEIASQERKTVRIIDKKEIATRKEQR